MQTGLAISAIGHGALIFLVLFGGWFSSEDLPEPEVADVSVITSEEFAALTRPFEAPEVSDAAPSPAPEPLPEEEPAPVAPEAVQDAPPEATAAPEAATPEAPDAAPEPLAPLAPEADVADAPPDAPAPPPAEEGPATELPPVPRPVPRVAPEAAPPPPPEADAAPEVVERTAPAPAEEAPPAPEEPPAAPEEATTEIVTEAERPSTAPTTSVRPSARPQRPQRVAQPTPGEASTAASENVETGETGQTRTASTGAEDIPQGPPMTGSERDAFRLSVQRCWVVDQGAESSRVTVTVSFALSREGRVQGDVRQVSASEGSDGAQRAAFDAARRAILRCGAQGYDLPAEKYGQWRNVEITFDPTSMRLR